MWLILRRLSHNEKILPALDNSKARPADFEAVDAPKDDPNADKDSNEDEENPENKNLFMREIKKFIDSTDSLIEGFPLTLAVLEGTLRRRRKEFRTFIDPHVIKRTDTPSGKRLTLNIPSIKLMKYRRLERRIARIEHSLKKLVQSFLVTMVSQFDTFIGGLARCVLYEKAEILNASERSITFADLISFKSIEDARESIVEKEVDALLRGSHESQIEWFEKRLKGKRSFKDALDCWPRFLEITERRNLFVHTDGTVSRQYLNICRQVGIREADSLATGEQLNVTSDYYRDSYECLVEVAISLGFSIWRAIKKSDNEKAFTFFIELCLAYLAEGKYHLACKLLDFGVNHFIPTVNEQSKKILIINRAQAYKWAGDSDKAKAILEAEDWSASDETFKLAIAVLNDDFDEVISIAKALHKIGKMSEEAYREWPLFKGLRKQEKFRNAFFEMYDEPLDEDAATIGDQTREKLVTESVDEVSGTAGVGN